MNGSQSTRRRSRTATFLVIAVLANSFGNLLLSEGMGRMPSFFETPFDRYLIALLTDPFLLPGAALMAIYTLTQVSLFSWADLSYVVPCIASSYVVTTLLGEFVLGERVELIRWFGVLLIFIGVTMVIETPVATKPHPDQGLQC